MGSFELAGWFIILISLWLRTDNGVCRNNVFKAGATGNPMAKTKESLAENDTAACRAITTTMKIERSAMAERGRQNTIFFLDYQ